MRAPRVLPLLVLGISSAALATDRTVPYTGHLEQNGVAATGTFSMRFAIVRNPGQDVRCLESTPPSPSCAPWFETHDAVEVKAGQFSVELGRITGIPHDVLRGGQSYLAIAIRGPSDAGFTLLESRQRLGAAPYAVLSEGNAPPVGTIMAWHKNLPGVPALGPDSGWVECDGRVVNDPASPLNGVTLPNLNGEARFLRGSTTSGVPQEDQLATHKHRDRGHTHTVLRPPYYDHELAGGANIRGTTGYYNPFSIETSSGKADLDVPVAMDETAIRHGSETRPRNMSVVWIIRIK